MPRPVTFSVSRVVNVLLLQLMSLQCATFKSLVERTRYATNGRPSDPLTIEIQSAPTVSTVMGVLSELHVLFWQRMCEIDVLLLSAYAIIGKSLTWRATDAYWPEPTVESMRKFDMVE